MRQVPPCFRFLHLAGSLPFHKAHENRLGEEKAKCNLENSLAGFRPGQLPLLRLTDTNCFCNVQTRPSFRWFARGLHRLVSQRSERFAQLRGVVNHNPVSLAEERGGEELQVVAPAS